ncbi:MAG: hypothetical protein KAI79_04810 [Bacteroidales bacterium]|nr:hypothetical protein [Bacteroidales bacterium]
MLQINNEVKDGLANIKDFNEFFTEAEFTTWIELVKSRHIADDKQLRKTLGVAYISTLNHANVRNEPRSDIITQLGLESKSDEYVAKLGYLLYKDEEFKAYGDEEVTENLNYFQFEDGSEVKSFWALSI